MKSLSTLAFLTVVVGVSACNRAGSDTGTKRGNLNSATNETEFTMQSGLSLDEIGAHLARRGATRVDAAYPLPWAAADGMSHGYHEYYNLADGTCLQLEIRREESGDKVIGYAKGPIGKSYVDKLVWLSDSKAGLINRSSTFTLSGEHVSGNR